MSLELKLFETHCCTIKYDRTADQIEEGDYFGELLGSLISRAGSGWHAAALCGDSDWEEDIEEGVECSGQQQLPSEHWHLQPEEPV